MAARARATVKTDMNESSSRSHSIFTLHLEATNAAREAHLTGQLNLCDLAGSERVDRSGVTGQALTEAKNINKSLSCLTGVFAALNQKSQHVPFRDSKLTYLLQPSFSGDGKTCMMINLSPTEASTFESLSTLRFGSDRLDIDDRFLLFINTSLPLFKSYDRLPSSPWPPPRRLLGPHSPAQW